MECRYGLQCQYDCFQVEYITLPGWQTSIEDVRDYEKLPHNAKKYIQMIEEHIQVPGMYVALSFYNMIDSYILTARFKTCNCGNNLTCCSEVDWCRKRS